MTDLAKFVPSMAINQQGDQGAILITMRGIGNDTAFTEVADPEVAIYVDGIYSPRPGRGRADVRRGRRRSGARSAGHAVRP